MLVDTTFDNDYNSYISIPGLAGEGLGGPRVLCLVAVDPAQGVVKADGSHPRRTTCFTTMYREKKISILVDKIKAKRSYNLITISLS